MALRCPARGIAAAKLLIRCRTPLTSLAHRSKPAVTADSRCNTQTPPRQHAHRTACNTGDSHALQRRHYCGLAAASSRQIRQHVAMAYRSPALVPAAACSCSSSISQRHQRRRTATAAAAAATAASALAAPGSTTVTAEELVAAHLAAIDSNRSKACSLRVFRVCKSDSCRQHDVRLTCYFDRDGHRPGHALIILFNAISRHTLFQRAASRRSGQRWSRCHPTPSRPWASRTRPRDAPCGG